MISLRYVEEENELGGLANDFTTHHYSRSTMGHNEQAGLDCHQTGFAWTYTR
jgi:hypothetical protein